MKSGFIPIYNNIISRKVLLCEKFKEEDNDTWEDHYIMEFNPGSRNSCEFLIKSDNSSFPTDLVSWGKEYCSFKANVINNIGLNDGSDFIEWMHSFYDIKNNYYRFNIYDNNARNICIYIITKNMTKIARFYMSDCVIKNPFFHSYNRNNSESPQVSLTLCTKQSVSINHLNNIAN